MVSTVARPDGRLMATTPPDVPHRERRSAAMASAHFAEEWGF